MLETPPSPVSDRAGSAVLNPLPACRICGGLAWAEHYRGRVRNGRFGQHTPGVVWRCETCDAAWLPDALQDYESAQYRELVDGANGVAAFHQAHDAEQAAKLTLVGTDKLRGRCVADVGCGAGSFLDAVRSFGCRTLAIEPANAYHEALRHAGHAVFPYAAEVPAEWLGRVELATCFSVVEHVEDPLALLQGIRRLLQPGGQLLLTTPNRDDWLLELLPEDYQSFFYRVVHRWYFTARSLRELGQRAGFTRVYTGCDHRYDFANFIGWLRDRRPTGLGRLPVEPVLDASFRASLGAQGRGDYLHAWLTA